MVSPAWVAFTKAPDFFATCKICGVQVSYKNNTSGLLSHLKRNDHSLTFSELLQRESSHSTSRSSPDFNHEEFRILQAKFITASDLSCKLVEEESYREMLSCLSSNFQSTSANDVQRDIEKLENDYKSMLQELKYKKNLVLIVDSWSSKNQNFSLYSIVVGYTDDNSNIERLLLGVIDTENLSEIDILITEELKKYDLSLQSFQILLSKTPFPAEKYGLLHIPCPSFSLHDILINSIKIKEIADVIMKCRKIATRSSKLKQTAYQLGISAPLPKAVPITQWNGIPELVGAVLTHGPTIEKVAEMNQFSLNDKEKNIAEHFLTLIKPLARTTFTLNAEGTRGSEILPRLLMTKSSIERIFEDFASEPQFDEVKPIITIFKNRLISELNSRCESYSKSNLIPFLLFFDPRFFGINAVLYGDMTWTEIEYDVVKLYSDARIKTEDAEYETPPPKKVKASSSCDLEEFLGTSNNSSSYGSERDEVMKEIRIYRKHLEEHRPKATESPANFWSLMSRTLPLLLSKARVYNGVPASSISTEKIFSKVGTEISKKLKNRTSSATNWPRIMVQASIGFERYFHNNSEGENENMDGSYDSGEEEEDDDDFVINSDEKVDLTEIKVENVEV